MRKGIIIIVLAVGGLFSLSAQEYRYEVGVAAGMGFYIGDINSKPFHKPGGAYGLMFRQNINYRWALKYNVSMTRVKGTTRGWQNVLPENAQYEFSRSVLDFGVQAEFNFFTTVSEKPIKEPVVFLRISLRVSDLRPCPRRETVISTSKSRWEWD